MRKGSSKAHHQPKQNTNEEAPAEEALGVNFNPH